MDLRTSTNFAEHAGRLLDKFAASTVLKYCSTALHFFKLLSSLGYLMETITVVQMAAILLTSSLSRSSDPGASGGRALIKALRWLSNITMVDVLQTIMYHQVINAFVVAKHTRDQQETAPFSLWVIMQFERRILQRNTPAWEIAFLGAVLTCVYGGLRFADAQRLPFRSFVLDDRTFRGVCDRTKTSHKGQPWGLLNCGLLSKRQFTWVSRYLMTLDDIWAQSGRESIHVLFFTIEDTDIYPMSYAEALRTLRCLISCPWRSGTPPGIVGVNFTMHSMNSTLLAWAIQVPGISEDMRLVQGHHRRVFAITTPENLDQCHPETFGLKWPNTEVRSHLWLSPMSILGRIAKLGNTQHGRCFLTFAKESQTPTVIDPVAEVALSTSDNESDSSKDSSIGSLFQI